MFKEIVITEKNADKINAILSEIQGRSRVRTIDASDIVFYCSLLEKRFADTYNKKAFFGSCFTINRHAQEFPKAYKGVPMTTEFSVRYDNYKFYLTAAERVQCGKKRISFTLSDAARELIVSRYFMRV